MKVFLTGAAGFIGYHTSLALLQAGHEVHGYDSVNDYYDPHYKQVRLEKLKDFSKFSFTKGLLEDQKLLAQAYQSFEPSHVIHLAAQAGVRYSIENPLAYIHTNIVGFQHMIELVRHHKPINFVYASSSSVYGGNKILPFSESQEVANPVSLYAATKISNEMVAKSYGNLYGIPSTGLRFFTVYGPYGRPDMALFSFADKILKSEEIPVFNHGQMGRDFTFIDDIVAGVLASLHKPQMNKIYNLGRGKKENLLRMVELLEQSLGKQSKRLLLPMQLGDVEETLADISKAKDELGYQPSTSIDEGIPRFVNWYTGHHSKY
jgi:UDP-glucuronate 4-epimerase